MPISNGMSLTVGTPVKILALVGLLGALGLGAGLTLLGRHTGSNAPATTIAPLHPHRQTAATPKPAKAAAKHHAHAMHAPAKATHARAHAKATHATPTIRSKPKVAKAKAGAPAAPANGLPAVVDRALQAHEVVVVELYDPQADVDAASVGEAQAGAKLAGVGFVPLDVLSQAQAAPLARKLGVLPDPTLLVFRAPDELAFRIDGFADRDTVAQAASTVLAGAVASATWRIRANQICATAGANPAQLNQLRALDVPAAASSDFQAFLTKYGAQLTGAAKGRAAAARAAGAAASALGLTDCTGRKARK